MAKYTYEDALSGKCEHWQVGTEVLESCPETSKNDDDVEQRPLNMAALIQSAYNAAGGEAAFNQEAKKNPSALFQAVLKMGVLQAAKQETPPPPQLEELTDSDIQALDSTTLKRILLASVGITKKAQLPE